MSETSSSILVQCSSKCKLRSAGTFVDFCFMMFAQEGIRGFPLLDNFFGHLGEFCAFLRIFSSTQQEKMKIQDIQVGINLREVQISGKRSRTKTGTTLFKGPWDQIAFFKFQENLGIVCRRCVFECRCSHLNFRFRACFKQGVP